LPSLRPVSSRQRSLQQPVLRPILISHPLTPALSQQAPSQPTETTQPAFTRAKKQTINMSPTYTMSAHLCKQIYSSWRQARQPSPEPSSPLPSPPSSSIGSGTASASSYFQQSRPASPEKRSLDNERGGEPSLSRQPSGSNWRWGSR
jgi:hypothetical protein